MRKFEIELSGEGIEHIHKGHLAEALYHMLTLQGVKAFAVGTREIIDQGAPAHDGWAQLDAILTEGRTGARAHAKGVGVLRVRDQNPQGLWRERLLVYNPEAEGASYYVEEGDAWPEAWRHLQWSRVIDNVPERMTGEQWADMQAVDESQE